MIGSENTSEIKTDTEQSTEKERHFIKDGHFFEPYKTQLKALFTSLGREDEWSENLADMLPYIQSKWIGTEHGNSPEKDQFTDEQTAAAMSILTEMNLTSETLPQPGEKFYQTIIVGGTTTANYNRLRLTSEARRKGVDIGEELVLVGQRPREERDGTNEELLGESGKFAGYDISQNDWVKNKLAQGAFDSHPKTPSAWKFTETDTAILSLLKVVDPTLRSRRIGLEITDITDVNKNLPNFAPDAPARLITDFYYETEDGHKIIVVNAKAVQRKNGDTVIPSRHTTNSVTKEWLQRYTPPIGARILYVTGNPHSLRTTYDTYQILKEMGREDIELVVAGTTPATNAPIQTYLGEVGRMMNIDFKRNYSTQEQAR